MQILATEEARRGVTLTLISSVIVGYTLLDLDEQLRVSEATVAGRRHNVHCSRSAFTAGGYLSSRCPRCAVK